MNPLLYSFETAYVETQHLLPLMSEYTNPQDFISRMVRKGELVRLKNGFFVIAEKIRKNPVPFEQIANLLHGPSYISFEWALSYYGMIPEGVYVVTSASANRSKTFTTPLATFDYFYLSHARYVVGIDQKESVAGKFLIATPEKALCDLVHQKSKKLRAKELLVDLIEARRMPEDLLKNLNKAHLLEIAESYRSTSVTTLTHALGLL